MYYINTKIKFRCKRFPSQGGNFRKHGWGAMCAKCVWRADGKTGKGGRNICTRWLPPRFHFRGFASGLWARKRCHWGPPPPRNSAGPGRKGSSRSVRAATVSSAPPCSVSLGPGEGPEGGGDVQQNVQLNLNAASCQGPPNVQQRPTNVQLASS